MLENVPIEILQQIVSHLPTASSVINLSLTSQTLYKKVSKDKYEIFRLWVRSHFPSIKVPPFWQDSAAVLTARSRAWERWAFVARECSPLWSTLSNAGKGIGTPSYRFGYVPVIDSHESWPGVGWADKKEVVVWGAAGRLIVRTTERGDVKWSIWTNPHDQMATNDICDVKLLRPHQNRNADGETVLVRRANNALLKVASTSKQHVFETLSKFDTPEGRLDCVDVGTNASPLMAVCNTETISLFPVHSEASLITPSATLHLGRPSYVKHRIRCARFLDVQRLAVSTQLLEGRARSPLNVYDLTPTGLINATPFSARCMLDGGGSLSLGRNCANTIAPLESTGGELFFSGWSDGIVRLYDLRTPLLPRMEYHDSVDDGQILSLLPIGHERFLAGSHQNACLKTFDTRMPGAAAYSYLNADVPKSSPSQLGEPVASDTTPDFGQFVPPSVSRRDIDIFLALAIHKRRRFFQPLPRGDGAGLNRYRGSIYTLSSPSPASPTVYCGIESHVIQLDFVSTDDARTNNLGVTAVGLDLPSTPDRADEILNLSCYERPRTGHESSDPIMLRKQTNFLDPREDADVRNDQAEPGWDERWQLGQYERNGSGGSGSSSGGVWRCTTRPTWNPNRNPDAQSTVRS